MYLKKVEIQGFKSFAEKTEIEFNDSITAIVGPNGSGKSNISDAIRWVLGEQSVKNLRGSKMEDIIFSGTDKRRALGFAEVTITFNNQNGQIPVDYSEVAVTRRMFRSGESEFYINKNSCRLKDIRELFMDSGIGKDGYSIIGQGKIDEILSNRPEDRRSIFEEAAGIVKYKTKKEEAERKLDRTTNNLVRIKDLIYEVENQKNSLEKEAEKAKIFKRHYSELKELEINLYIRDVKKLNKQIDDLREERIKIEGEISIIEEEKISLDKKYNLLKQNIEALEEEIDESRTIRFDSVRNYENNKNKINILSEKVSFLMKDLERVKSEKLHLEETIKKLSDTILDNKNERETVLKKLEELKNEFEENSGQLSEFLKSFETIEQEREKDKDVIINLYNGLSDKRSEINSILSFNENIEKRINELSKDKELVKNNILELNNRIQELFKKEEDLNQELNSKKEELELLINNNSDLEENNRSISEEIKTNQIKLQGLNSSYNLYKNMEEGYEGYYKSVKGLLQSAKKNPSLASGLVGVVADLFSVEDKFVKAIDTSLGSYLQNIVVENEEAAKNMVEFLKQHRLGRATFLPLNVIKGNPIKLNDKDIKEFNIQGLGSDLISYDKKYDGIFRYLLGRTIIVDNIDSAIKFANKIKHSYKIVTLDGEVFNIGGSITGGSSGNNSISIINRKAVIRKMKKEIDQTTTVLNELLDKKKLIEEEVAKSSVEINTMKNELKNIELKIIDVANERLNSESDVNKLNLDIEKKSKEKESLLYEIKQLNIKKEELISEINSLEEKIETTKLNISKTSQLVEEKRQIRSKLEKKDTDLKISINLMNSTLKNLEDLSEKYNDDYQRISNQIVEKINSINEIEKNILNHEEEKQLIEVDIQNQEIQEKDISEKLNHALKKKENYMKTFYDEQDRIKVISNKLTDIERVKNNLDIRLTRYETQLENIHNRVFEDYEVTFEDALYLEKEIPSIQFAQSKVKELKEAIKELGNVNIGSIEEFKNTLERYEFLTKQQNDLIKAKEDLNEVIKDMENKMKTQFVKSLKEIDENFQKVFTILFNGGKARIELEEGEDILNAGIDIKAQPPGKKLQSLSLLSGGEKSLTAVALLFAILKTKPAPFCILDEIDAALDEANITRYTSYLKGFNDKTQFVLITHRKTTMEIADVLYGVTMEEQGISKLISVKLKDNNLENIAG